MSVLLGQSAEYGFKGLGLLIKFQQHPVGLFDPAENILAWILPGSDGQLSPHLVVAFFQQCNGVYPFNRRNLLLNFRKRRIADRQMDQVGAAGGLLEILDFAVGGNFPGAPDSDTEFPVTMEVDYVRVYSGEP